ncbi:mitochondrial distribution and morphology [Polyrhizophydium stewartii]|uniref:Mitochondrial distribution and morphology n=1 Tax=Polyrhizophydium stewartii TaxID=2732419 RepID=A0ABR4N7E2_9FUNG
MADSVLQRRLEPIYEMLDAQNFRGAVQLCTKALKKTGADAPIKALKSYALLQLGNTDEAYELASQVAATKPVDAATLQALRLTLLGAGKPHDLVPLYESAFEATKNVEWANHWFMALVRIGDLKGYQLAATKLHKLFKDSKYYFWAVMSLYMQAISPGCTNKALLLSLAQKTAEKAVKDSTLTTAETILDEQSKFDESKEILAGPLSDLIRVESERSRVCLEIELKRADWGSAAAIATEMLQKNIDDWASYTALAQAIGNLKSGESLIADAWSLIESLQQRSLSQSQPCRGPFLAELLFVSRRIPRAGGSEPSLASLIVKYVRQFGSALSCFDDLLPYLRAVDPSDYAQIAEKLRSEFPLSDTELPESGQESFMAIDFIRMDVTCRKILCFMSETLFTEVERDQQISELLQRYHLSVPLGAALDNRERQPGDDYISLAAEYLLAAFVASRDRQILYRMIALVEFAIDKSKHNYHFRLLLVRLYFEAGVSQRALDHAQALDVKQVQLDTLSYLFTTDLELFGLYGQASQHFSNGLDIYDRNKSEVTTEAILQAFRFGTFSKIPEFIKFFERLDRSVQRSHFRIQISRCELMYFAKSIEDMREFFSGVETDMFPWQDEELDKCHDNRDFTVLSQCSNSKGSIEDKILGGSFPAPSMAPDPARAMRIVLRLSRIVGGRPVDSASAEWDAIVDEYGRLVDGIASETALGLSRTLAESITAVIESLISLSLALSVLQPVVGASKKAKAKQAATRDPVVSKAVEAISAATSKVVAALSERKQTVSNMVDADIKGFLFDGQFDPSGPLAFLADASTTANTAEFVRRGWLLSLDGYIQALKGRIPSV